MMAGGAAGAGGSGGGAAGSGGTGGMDVAAILKIGDETWEFDEFQCAFDVVEADGSNFPFIASAFGEDTSGVRVQLTADIEESGGGTAGSGGEGGTGGSGGVREITRIELVDDPFDPTVFWLSDSSAGGETVLIIEREGEQVTGSGLFDDQLTDEPEQMGTLDATCTETTRGP